MIQENRRWVFTVLLILVFASQTTLLRAAVLQEEVDLSAFVHGASRDDVLAKMGMPEASTLNDAGQIVDTWDIIVYQNQTPKPSGTHEFINKATLGLWSAMKIPDIARGFVSGVASPIQMDRTREEHKIYMVTYDEDEKIQEVAIDMSHKPEYLLAL